MNELRRTRAWSEADDDTGAAQTLTVAGHEFELVARSPVGGSWVAWVRRTSSGAASLRLIRPLLDQGRTTESVADYTNGLHSTGATAAVALDRLSDRIRGTVSEATRPDHVP